MHRTAVTLFGKTIRKAARLRGGGSALPGLVIEKIDPNFVKHTLASLPHGTVIISGTNGKTTTTKMVVELLEGQGLKVFTNKTGSNFSRGVAAALLESIDIKGRLDADIAVLELDEAHAVRFVKTVPPKYSLLLNVMRDQLDRFGEIDTTAAMLEAIANATSDTIVINREDPRLLAISKKHTEHSVFFGLSDDTRRLFPNDDNLHGDTAKQSNDMPVAISTLQSLENKQAVFTLADATFSTELKLEGVYNVFNAAAALGLIAKILPTFDSEKLKASLSQVTPAFGRGETLIVRGQPLDLVLVKNPGGFRLGLASFSPENTSTMIAINDNYADGRDMSWLWDVDFSSLQPGGVDMVAGVRAHDMALRLEHDDISPKAIKTELSEALEAFITATPDQSKRIYCTYTAMLTLRKLLANYTEIKESL